MNNFFRTIIAGWGAKKLGGGCLSTIIIFIVIYSLLGKCNQKSRAAEAPKNRITVPVSTFYNFKLCEK
jgi:hypothetical protein